jgi:hypothetical protein
LVFFSFLVPGCDNVALVGNGLCNDETNNANCNYDGGDCCVVNSITDYCYQCLCHFLEICAAGYHPLVGNGFCNDNTNTAECDYDGGECCGYNVNMEQCTECKCSHQETCLAGVNHAFIGDGVCNDETNIAECNYDGGDCCGFDIIYDHCTDCNCHSLYFNQSGNVPLIRDNLVTTFYGWGEEYIVSFDFEAIKAMAYSTLANILHLSIGGQYDLYGDRIPAVFVNQLNSEQVIEFRSSVSGDHDHAFDFSYQLNTPYHIEISQLKKNDILMYSIQINNVTVHSTVNTDVEVFPAVHLYLTDPWLSTFGTYGTVRNLWVASGEFTSKLFNFNIIVL